MPACCFTEEAVAIRISNSISFNQVLCVRSAKKPVLSERHLQAQHKAIKDLDGLCRKEHLMAFAEALWAGLFISHLIKTTSSLPVISLSDLNFMSHIYVFMSQPLSILKG